MKKKSPRAKFISEVKLKRLAGYAWDAMRLASTHDPDHAKELKRLEGLIYAEVKLQDRRFSDLCARVYKLERFRDFLLAKGWVLKDGSWKTPSSWAEDNKEPPFTPFSESKLAKGLDDNE